MGMLAIATPPAPPLPRPEAEGEFVELRSGVVAVVGFHIGAGLLKRDGARLQPDDQAEVIPSTWYSRP